MPTKRIAFFTGGDSHNASTWSNVPYLFAKSLEKKGYELARIDYSPNKFLERVFNTSMFYLFIHLLKKDTCPRYSRTRINRILTYRRIKKATKKIGKVDMNLFLTYELSNPYSDAPTVIWCDWSDEVCMLRRDNTIHRYERYAVRKEREAIKHADLMYTMFPVCKDQMKEMYGREIFYLNRNVINNLYEEELDIESLVNSHSQSNAILFIGNIRYKNAAVQLIRAFNRIRERNDNLKLNIIGMTSKDLGIEKDDHINAFGYLRKDNNEERKKYYELLINSRMIVNPAQKWAAYSSIIEAMYFGCPVVVTPFDDFVREFGENIDFGQYCNENNLIEIINSILNTSDYEAMCRAAHNKVKDYTWDNYVESFISHLKENGIDI